jgi:LysR family transcriptional regulator, glycine cleavage system transcriptional activator
MPESVYILPLMQPHQRLPLNALRTFESAARLLSFKAAADELCVTPQSVSSQIRQLEAEWGVQLFTRKPRQISLTDAGRSLAQVVNRTMNELRREMDTFALRNRKTVTLAVGPIFGARWLLPRMDSFRKLYPNIDLVLHHSPRITSAEQMESMVMIDWGNGDWPGLHAKRLFEVTFMPTLSPALLQRLGGMQEPSDLARYPAVHKWDREEWVSWLRLVGLDALRFAHEVTMRDSNIVLQAALDGHSVIMGTFPLISAEVEAGRLVCPFDIAYHPTRAYHVLTRPGARSTAEIRAVCEWIESEASLMG